MDNKKKKIVLKRGMAYILDEAIMFLPTFIVTMFIYIELVNIGILNHYKYMSLAYLYYYPVPWFKIPDFLIKWATGVVTTGINDMLFILLTPVIFKIIISASFESSKWQGSIGKKITQCYLVNKDGTKVKLFKVLMRNIIKYIFIIIFPPLILLRLHDVITKTQVISEKEN